jgi:hypothetical protein
MSLDKMFLSAAAASSTALVTHAPWLAKQWSAECHAAVKTEVRAAIEIACGSGPDLILMVAAGAVVGGVVMFWKDLAQLGQGMLQGDRK